MTREDTVGPTFLKPGDGRQRRVITDLVTIKAGSADTGGSYTLVETETPPGGGCPPHSQRHENASYYVLAGRYTFLVGEELIELGPGGYVFAPRGTVHAFANVGAAPARMLVLLTPGGIHEQFIDDAGDHGPRPQWEPDMERVLAVAPKYGIEFSIPVDHADTVPIWRANRPEEAPA